MLTAVVSEKWNEMRCECTGEKEFSKNNKKKNTKEKFVKMWKEKLQIRKSEKKIEVKCKGLFMER